MCFLRFFFFFFWFLFCFVLLLFFFLVLFCFLFVCLFVCFWFILFCFCFLFFPFFFSFFFPLPPFFFYSSPDLNLHLHSILHDFSFKNTQFSASERAHPPHTPSVCALRHPLCVQACNWRWRSTKWSPNAEDGCTALCSFGVLAVVKCCKQCLIAMIFFFFSYT